MTGRKDPKGPNTVYLPDGWNKPIPEREQEHRCGNCFGPLGKSAIRCKNEPGDGLDRARAWLDKRAEIREGNS